MFKTNLAKECFTNQNLVEDQDFKYLLLDFSSVNYVDTTAITTLLEVGITIFRASNCIILFFSSDGRRSQES